MQSLPILLVLFLSCFSASIGPPNPFKPGEKVLCIYERVGIFNCNNIEFENTQELADVPGTPDFYIDVSVVCVLLLFAGFATGINMGLHSHPRLKLEVLARSGSPDEQTYVRGILPLVKRYHLVLVTLLLVFVGCVVCLPIFLTRLLGDAWVAIGVGIPLALFFGEIIPSALFFSGGLGALYYSAWLVWGLIIVLGVVAYPLSLVLDKIIGSESITDSMFKRGDLKELVQLHTQGDDGLDVTSDQPQRETPLLQSEVALINGVLEMREKTAAEAMRALDKTYMLSSHQELTADLLKEISREGHSRVPVYHGKRDIIVGVLLTSDLIGITANERRRVDDIEIDPLPRVLASVTIAKLLEQFRINYSQMAILLDPNDHMTPIGIITFEDVIAVFLKAQIFDERDKRNSTRSLQPQHHTPNVVILKEKPDYKGLKHLLASSFRQAKAGEESISISPARYTPDAENPAPVNPLLLNTPTRGNLHGTGSLKTSVLTRTTGL